MGSLRSLFAVGFTSLAACVVSAEAATIRVGAAISLKESMDSIVAKYEAATGDHVEPTYGSSGQLLTQIRSGAAVDVFVSAANKQMDELQSDNLVDGMTRRVVVTNHLVLIVPSGSADAPDSFAKLADASVAKVAIGEPKTVPAGEYAEQVFTALNLTGPLHDKLVYGTNVRQVLSYVERGEVSAGVVYLTDAKESGDKVRIVATAEANTHKPIVYPGAVLRASKEPAAAMRFLAYLSEGDAQAIFKDKGFVTAESARPSTQPAATQPAAAGR